MSQKLTKTFRDEIFSQSPKKTYSTNNIDVYHIDDIRSLDILDSKDYIPENNRNFRYVLVVIDN